MDPIVILSYLFAGKFELFRFSRANGVVFGPKNGVSSEKKIVPSSRLVLGVILLVSLVRFSGFGPKNGSFGRK